MYILKYVERGEGGGDGWVRCVWGGGEGQTRAGCGRRGKVGVLLRLCVAEYEPGGGPISAYVVRKSVMFDTVDERYRTYHTFVCPLVISTGSWNPLQVAPPFPSASSSSSPSVSPFFQPPYSLVHVHTTLVISLASESPSARMCA